MEGRPGALAQGCMPHSCIWGGWNILQSALCAQSTKGANHTPLFLTLAKLCALRLSFSLDEGVAQLSHGSREGAVTHTSRWNPLCLIGSEQSTFFKIHILGSIEDARHQKNTTPPQAIPQRFQRNPALFVGWGGHWLTVLKIMVNWCLRWD